MNFLKWSEIRPRGWLKKQLEIQAAGLSGSLDKIWPDIRDSKWIGGDREGWERVPYWLDGFIPLAYLLDDEEKKSVAKRYVDAILAGQQEDGWLCPCTVQERAHYDLWALFLILKTLTVYADCSGDGRIEECVYRALKQLSHELKAHTLFNWAQFRWFECLIPLLWLKQRRFEPWMSELAQRLRAQGADYSTVSNLWTDVKEGWSYETHVVNGAMALKGEALYCAFTGEKSTGEAEKLYRILTKYHGTAYGHFTGDECFSGDSPVQGTELCGVAEAMYSYEWLFLLTGESAWGDRLESLAFNALPATIEADMWSHQYVQMVNQPASIVFPDPPVFRSNGCEANVFGLEPNFGCCTANFNQAWPKFARSVLVKDENGFTVVSCAPFLAKSVYKEKKVTIECVSEYPFRQAVKLIIDSESDESCVLRVRIPSETQATSDAPETKENFLVYTIGKGHREIQINFVARPRWIERPRGLYALGYGALLFALPVKSEKTKREYVRDGVERKFPYCDYENYPASAWEYAFSGKNEFEVVECPYDAAFDRENPPLKIKARLIPIDWGWEEGRRFVPALLPKGGRTGADEEKFLQPYGATTLRMTELPILHKG